MIDQETIERIVAEVLKAINKPGNFPEPAKLKPKLVVVKVGSNIDSSKLALLEAKWNLQFVEFGMEQLQNPKEKVVFFNTSLDLVVKGALGITDTPESLLLAQYLLSSVPVTFIPSLSMEKILFEREMVNVEYKSLLLGYQESLKKFGVEIVSFDQFLQKTDVKQEKFNNPVSFDSKVLTQRDVQQFPGNKITINKRTIITPLARDAAKELGKTIEIIDNK